MAPFLPQRTEMPSRITDPSVCALLPDDQWQPAIKAMSISHSGEYRDKWIFELILPYHWNLHRQIRDGKTRPHDACPQIEITLTTVWWHSQRGPKLKVMSRSQIGQTASASEFDVSKRKLTRMLALLTSSCCSAMDCEMSLMLNRLEWTSLLTRQVSAALERINCGSYGVCLRCGQRIAPKRIAALPWAEFCTSCQEQRATGTRIVQ